MPRISNKELFLRTLRAQGNRAGNTSMQRDLKWNSDQYWKIRDELLEDGAIEKGRGYGGSVVLVTSGQDVAETTVNGFQRAKRNNASEWTSDEALEAPAEKFQSESQLYEPIRKQLGENWARERQLDACYCEITALQGRRDTGGSWTPPITVS